MRPSTSPTHSSSGGSVCGSAARAFLICWPASSNRRSAGAVQLEPTFLIAGTEERVCRFEQGAHLGELRRGAGVARFVEHQRHPAAIGEADRAFAGIAALALAAQQTPRVLESAQLFERQ